MENRPLDNNIIGAVGSFNLNDSKEYFIIPETNNGFVEVSDNKGEIQSRLSFKKLSTSIKQYFFQF